MEVYNKELHLMVFEIKKEEESDHEFWERMRKKHLIQFSRYVLEN